MTQSPDMVPSSFEPAAAFAGQGAVSYQPVLADPACGFGPIEVHPNKVPFEHDGTVELRHNGEFLAICGQGKYERFVCCGTENASAQECAEISAGLYNGGKPTRVVDACGAESVSRYNEELLRKRAAERGVEVMSLSDFEEAMLRGRL